MSHFYAPNHATGHTSAEGQVTPFPQHTKGACVTFPQKKEACVTFTSRKEESIVVLCCIQAAVVALVSSYITPQTYCELICNDRHESHPKRTVSL